MTVAEDTATTLDAALVPGGGVAVYPVVVESGRVLDAKNEDPGMGEVCVDAFDGDGNRLAGRQDTWDWIFVLPAGDYFFRFSDCTDPVEYATTWYPSALEFADAEPITVVAGTWNGTFFISTAGRLRRVRCPRSSGRPGATTCAAPMGDDVISAGLGADVVYGYGGSDLHLPGRGERLRRRRGRARLGVRRQRATTGPRAASTSTACSAAAATIACSAAGPATSSSAGPGSDALDGGTGPNVCRLGETLVDC